MNILLEIFHSFACPPPKTPTCLIMPKLKLLEFVFVIFGQIFIVIKGINIVFKDCSCHVYGTSEIVVNALRADYNPITCQLKLFFLTSSLGIYYL